MPGAPPWTRSPSAANSLLGSFPMMGRSSVRCSARVRNPLPPTSRFALRGRFPPSFTSFGAPRRPAAITWSMAIPRMGYEIAGGLGVKMARPDREVIVMVGDGSYLMLNNEIATSVMLDKKLVIVLLDNRGYGCINRLQQHCGSKPFNNMLGGLPPVW